MQTGIYQKVEIFDILGPHSHPSAPIDVKYCTAKRTQVPVGPATSRPCGEKNLIFGLWVKAIPAVCHYAAILPVIKRLQFSRLCRLLSYLWSFFQDVAATFTVLFTTSWTLTSQRNDTVSVVLSPITEDFVDFCRRRRPLRVSSLRLDQTFYWFAVSSSVLCLTAHHTSWVPNHFSCG